MDATCDGLSARREESPRPVSGQRRPAARIEGSSERDLPLPASNDLGWHLGTSNEEFECEYYEDLTLILVERPNGLDPVAAGERDDQVVGGAVNRTIQKLKKYSTEEEYEFSKCFLTTSVSFPVVTINF